MANEFTLTDGTKSIALYWSAAGQQQYRLMYDSTVRANESIAQWHRPDGYPPELVNLHDDNRVAYLTMDITKSSDVDDVLDAITTLKRWVDGANQQAARYWQKGDVDRISLKVKRQDSTVATLQPVLYGFVDDSRAHYTAVATENNLAEGVVIGLYLAPYGEAETDIELHSDLENGAFVFESSTGGLAAGWAAIGSPTLTLDQATKLIGSRSQKVVASAATQGIQSNTFTGVTSCAAYIYCYVTSGEAVFRVRDITAGSTVVTATLDATDSGGVSDKTRVDDGGRTWYRVPITSASLTSGNNHALQVKTDAAATFYVDGAWMQTGTTSVPDAWISYGSLENRADQTTSDSDQINWVDTWGIPGDAPAVVRWEINISATTNNGRYIFAGSGSGGNDGNDAEMDEQAMGLDASSTGDIDTQTTGTKWTANADTARYGGVGYLTFTETADELGDSVYGSVDIYSLMTTERRVLAIAKYAPASDNVAKLYFSVVAGSQTLRAEVETAFPTTGSWCIVDLGLLNLSEFIVEDYPLGSGALVDFYIHVTDTVDADVVDIDGVFLLPANDGFLFWKGWANFYNNLGADEIVWIDGNNEGVLQRGSYATVQPALGSLWTLPPGSTFARTAFVMAEDNFVHDLTDPTAEVTARVTPRTRHLLGTI